MTNLRILERTPRTAFRITVCLLVVLAGFARGLAAADSSSPPNVLLITVDTLRADHLGCYGDRAIKTPNIDGLAREGVRFERAYSQVPLTLPSHVVILTGTYPMYNHVRDFTGTGLPENIGIISEAFKRHGYATAAFVSAFVLDGAAWGLGRGFDVYDDHFDPRQYQSQNPGNIQRRGDETVDQFLKWFAHRPAGKPFFVWIHLYDPHSPYDPPEPYRSQYRTHPYDGEIAFDDAQVGRIFKELRDAGIYDRTAIAFLSDHGESLGEHGEAEHGFFLYNATIHVPLIIKPAGTPGQARSVDSVVSTVDVAPTLLQMARLDDTTLTRQFQGRSLASLLSGSPPAESRNRTAYSETLYPLNNFGWSPLKSLITRAYAYIEAPQPELYDLKTDPGEKRNLFAQHRAEANSFKGQLDALEARYQGRTSAGAAKPLSQETIEKLKSLGYLAYSAPAAAARPGAKLADPKSKIQIYQTIERANDLAEAGRYGEADRLVAQLARTETKLYLIPFMRGEYASFEGRHKDAQQYFLACLKLNPDFQQAILGLAKAYHADGQPDKATTFLELDVHKYPHDFLGYYGLAVIASEAHNFAAAIPYFQACLREKPDYGLASLGLGIAQVESQKYADALPNLRRAGGLGPQEVLRLNYLGIATDRMGDRQGAIKLYQQALALGPDFIPARLNLAFAYRDAGEMDKARAEFKIICSSDSKACQQFRSYFE